MLQRHWAFNVGCSLWPTADASVDRFYAVIPRAPGTLQLWLQGKTNVRVNGNTVTWPGSLPTAEEEAWVETCYNRLFNFVWRNWTFDRWTSFPLHSYLSNRVVVGKWSRIHEVKKWPGSHTVDSPHLPPKFSRQVVPFTLVMSIPKLVTQRTYQPLGVGPQRF